MVAKSYYAIKGDIDKFRTEIGRDILVYTPARNPCSICTTGGFYDSISDKSTYIKCPECKGVFWRDDVTEHTIQARVHWTTNEAMNITPGGRYFTGDAYAVVDPEYHSVIQAAQEPGGKVKIDGQELTITRINPEGAATINRYKVILLGSGKRPE